MCSHSSKHGRKELLDLRNGPLRHMMKALLREHLEIVSQLVERHLRRLGLTAKSALEKMGTTGMSAHLAKKHVKEHIVSESSEKVNWGVPPAPPAYVASQQRRREMDKARSSYVAPPMWG